MTRRGLGLFLPALAILATVLVGSLAWLTRDFSLADRRLILIGMILVLLGLIALSGVNRYLQARVALAPYEAAREHRRNGRPREPRAKRVHLPGPPPGPRQAPGGTIII